MIYVGIDDTDVRDSPGTNKLARHLIRSLADRYECIVAVRHQLLFDPRIPYTSKNSSASILLRPTRGGAREDLAAAIRAIMAEWFVPGSDPGLCLAKAVPEEVTHFGQRCQREIVAQDDARGLASRSGIYLAGLGGTEDGVIGALAAVGLVAGGDDGRVVSIGSWPDDLSGPVEIDVLQARGVEVRHAETREPVCAGLVDVGKHLRPNYRGARIVLFATPAPDGQSGSSPWQAVRLT